MMLQGLFAISIGFKFKKISQSIPFQVSSVLWVSSGWYNCDVIKETRISLENEEIPTCVHNYVSNLLPIDHVFDYFLGI